MAKTTVEIAQAGDYEGHWQMPYELTVEDLERMVQNFGMEVVIDYEHATHNPEAEMAPAAGWVQRVWVDGESLYGEVEWNERAEELIDSGEYRYLSPVIDLYAVDPHTANPIGAKLISVGLVNTPFIEGMESVQNASRPQKGELARLSAVSRELVLNNKFHRGDDGARPKAASDATPTTTEEAPMKDESKFQAFLNRIKGILNSSASDELGVLDDTRQLVKNSEELETARSRVSELEEENESLQSRVQELEGKLQAQEEEAAEEILNAAVEQGKIKKADLDDWKERIQNNREGTVALLNSIPKNTVLPGGGDGPSEPENDSAPAQLGSGGKMMQYVSEQAQQAG